MLSYPQAMRVLRDEESRFNNLIIVVDNRLSSKSQSLMTSSGMVIEMTVEVDSESSVRRFVSEVVRGGALRLRVGMWAV